MSMRAWLLGAASALCLLVAVVVAECPNGCSGNGDCMAKDMCNCYKGFEGNDCADRTCSFGFAFVDTPKGDIDMDRSRLTPNWILTNSQQAPAGTYEYFHPDAKQNEAHFYMECSNKGICDRSTGICQCFDGFEGIGCQRTTCPSSCNGHGTCESIRELGDKAGGTLFGLESPAGAVTYDLWDSNSTYGCRCDPGFFGPDCNKRTCKVGVDPMFLSAGTPTYETFMIHAYIPTGNALPANSWVRLRVFDFNGESYITDKITVVDDATVTADQLAAAATAVQNVIMAVPNLSFQDVICEPMGAGTHLAGYKSIRLATSVGMSVVCQFADNPGKLRIPEVVSYDYEGIAVADQAALVVTTAQQGMNDEWFNIETVHTVGSVSADGLTITLTDAAGDMTSVLGGATGLQLVKIGPHIVLVSAVATGPGAATIVYPLKHALAAATPIFSTPSADPATTGFTLTISPATTAAVVVGEDYLQYDANTGVTDAGFFAPGDTIFFQNAFYTVQQTYLDVTSTKYRVKLDKPFGGDSDTGADTAASVSAYKVTFPPDPSNFYNYVSECSGRGLCGYETGICTCFKGYTNDNCNMQNILAL